MRMIRVSSLSASSRSSQIVAGGGGGMMFTPYCCWRLSICAALLEIPVLALDLRPCVGGGRVAGRSLADGRGPKGRDARAAAAAEEEADRQPGIGTTDATVAGRCAVGVCGRLVQPVEQRREGSVVARHVVVLLDRLLHHALQAFRGHRAREGDIGCRVAVREGDLGPRGRAADTLWRRVGDIPHGDATRRAKRLPKKAARKRLAVARNKVRFLTNFPQIWV